MGELIFLGGLTRLPTTFTTLPAHVYQLDQDAYSLGACRVSLHIGGRCAGHQSLAPWGILVLLAVGMFALLPPGFRIALDALWPFPSHGDMVG